MRRSTASSSSNESVKDEARAEIEFPPKVTGVDLGKGPSFTVLQVTIGAETHSPTKYHSFTVGPFSASVTLEPGEDVEHAYLRARARLTALVETEFLLRTKEFEDHFKRSRG